MRPIVNALVSGGVAGLLVTSALVFAQEPQPAPPRLRVEVLKAETKKEAAKPAAPPLDADLERLLQPLLGLIQKKAVRPAPAPPQAIMVGGMIVNGPQQKAAQIRNFTQQFRVVLRVEYHFIRTVCALSPEQRKQIAQEGERALRDAAVRYTEAMSTPRRLVMVNGRRVVSPEFPNPRKLILEALAKGVKAHATPDQAARYQAELDKRDEYRKEVFVHNIVAKLDQEVLLSPEQRDKISAALLAHWDEAWGGSLSLSALLNIDRYFPNLPRERIDPLLTEPQKQILGKFPVQNVTFNDNGIAFGGRDEPLEEEELTAARQAADKAEQDDQK